MRQLAGAGARRRPIRIVGNLPYNVSAPILLEVLRVGSQEPVDDAIFMLQREVADRVTAKPGSASYGPLAVMTALRARATRVLSLPPGAFRPMPRVRSALVALRFRRPERAPADLPRFESMVRALFTQRRKQTGNALAAFAGAAGVDPVASCDRAGLDPRRRPGELTLSELIDLSEVLASGPR